MHTKIHQVASLSLPFFLSLPVVRIAEMDFVTPVHPLNSVL